MNCLNPLLQAAKMRGAYHSGGKASFNANRIPIDFTRFRYTERCFVLKIGREAEMLLRSGGAGCVRHERWQSTTRVIGARQ